MIYFDSSSTSPVDSEVLDAMLPYLKEEYGNPSSKYYCKAKNAKNAVEEARAKVAKLIKAKPEEIIFTAGATESTNFIIKGYSDYEKYYGGRGNHIITSVAEHKATLNVCKYLNGEIYSNNDPRMQLFRDNPKVNRGYEVTFVGVNKYGCVEPDVFEREIKDVTILASFMYINNEVGTINDIYTLAKICKKYGIAFHIDATQALGRINIDVTKIAGEDLQLYMSFSAHKLYGPKGIGAAYLKNDEYGLRPISSLMHGGEQENGVRGGTLAVHNIVGFGKAAEIALKQQGDISKKNLELDEYFKKKIDSSSKFSIIGEGANRLPGIVSILVNERDFNNERFINKISDELAISTGSACSAGQPSHVITAMGLADKINRVLRISISKYTTKKDVDLLVDILEKNI